MATKVSMSFDLPFPAAAVRDQMRSPDLIHASEKSRGALEVDVKDLASDDTRHEYEIMVVNYGRGIKGEDRSKRETSYTTVKWELPRHLRLWTWKGEHPINLTGEDIITETPHGSRLSMTATIDVKIPVVGRIVAKKLKEGFEENWPNYARLVQEFCAKQTSE